MFAGSPLLSRGLALALLVCVAVLLPYTVIDRLASERAAYRDDIRRTEALLRAFRERAVDTAALQEASARLRNDRSLRRIYLEADSETLAGARVQSRITSLIEAAGATLVTTQVLNGSDHDRFRRVTVRTQMRATVDQLRQIFHALETGRPYLFIDRLAVRTYSRSSRRRRGAARDAAIGPDTLIVSYDVYGLLWGERS